MARRRVTVTASRSAARARRVSRHGTAYTNCRDRGGSHAQCLRHSHRA